MKGTKKYRAAKAATAVGLHITISGMKITARAIAGTVLSHHRRQPWRACRALMQARAGTTR